MCLYSGLSVFFVSSVCRAEEPFYGWFELKFGVHFVCGLLRFHGLIVWQLFFLILSCSFLQWYDPDIQIHCSMA